MFDQEPDPRQPVIFQPDCRLSIIAQLNATLGHIHDIVENAGCDEDGMAAANEVIHRIVALTDSVLDDLKKRDHVSVGPGKVATLDKIQDEETPVPHGVVMVHQSEDFQPPAYEPPMTMADEAKAVEDGRNEFVRNGIGAFLSPNRPPVPDHEEAF